MKNIFLYLIAFCLSVVVSCGNSKGSAEVETKVERQRPPVPEKPNKIAYHLNANKIFRDGNDVHLAAASKIGINPLASRDGINDASRELVAIDAECYAESFVLDKLTHSTPHLVPEAAALLEEIGYAFQDSLRNKHKTEYRVIVTSVLRTDADIKSLSKRNVNSVERSVHCYGTTMDISCKGFVKHNPKDKDAREVDLIAVLGEVLRDLKNAGRCYVKYEIKQHCFHITARQR